MNYCRSGARAAFKKEALLWVNLGAHPFILSAWWVTEVSGGYLWEWSTLRLTGKDG